MKIKLDTYLPAIGCELSPRDFREALVELFDELHPNRTEDDLVCEPYQALTFCNLARAKIGHYGIPDYPILKTLMNVRKRGLSRSAREELTDNQARELFE